MSMHKKGNFSNQPLSDIHCCVVGNSGYNCDPSVAIERVVLKNCKITDDDIDGLVLPILEKAHKRHKLWCLILTANNFTHVGLAKILNAVLQMETTGPETQCITEIDLSYNNLGTEGAKVVADFITKTRKLEGLQLGSNKFGDEGVYRIAVALKAQQDGRKEGDTVICRMSLPNNQVGADAYPPTSFREHLKSGEALGAYLADSSCAMVMLDLSWNLFGPVACVQIAQGVALNTSLYCLDFSTNTWDNVGEEVIVLLGRNKMLRSLSLNSNVMNVAATVALGELLASSPNLNALYLNATDVDISTLVKYLPGCSLKSVSLGSNELDDPEILVNALAQIEPLREVQLFLNTIENDGAIAIAKLLMQGTHWENINLDGSEIGNAGALELCKAMVVNKAVKKLSIRDCQVEPSLVSVFNALFNETGSEGDVRAVILN